MNDNQTFFQKYRTSITIVIVAIIITVGLLVWNGKEYIENKVNPVKGSLTPEQIQMIVHDVGTSTGRLSKAQEQKIESDNGKGEGSLSEEQRQRILNDSAH